ncbi:hypothetical protein ACFY6V_41630 [Streptomyces massasporeus]
MSDVTVSAEAVEEVRLALVPTDVLDEQLIGQLPGPREWPAADR